MNSFDQLISVYVSNAVGIDPKIEDIIADRNESLYWCFLESTTCLGLNDDDLNLGVSSEVTEVWVFLS